MTQSTVGKIGLESMMNRANILFTSGYRFKGELNCEQLEASATAVFGNIIKFEFLLHFETQGRFHWRPADASVQFVTFKDSDDIDEEFKHLCHHSLSLVDDGKHCPMLVTVIKDRQSDEFIIAQTSEHTYLDARSSEVIFDWIIEHYNATVQDNSVRANEILAETKSYITLHSSEIIDMLSADGHDRDANIEAVTNYPIADIGGYAIPIDVVPACLHSYKQQRFVPVMRFFSVGNLISQVRSIYPEISKNSVICAALAKGFYNLNVNEKSSPEKHMISFKMLSDLLSPELRRKYCGNYIAFVPVSVEGSLTVAEIAKEIHERTREIKANKLDLTLFELTEKAIEDAMVGTVDEALSFIVTNWSNYNFLTKSEYLHGCRSLRHQSGVNIDPRDTAGAVLVNRPVLVINLSQNDELCLSFFPSLRSEQETLAISEQITEVFKLHA